MATMKVKFRASSVPTKEGTLFYQVVHGRVARQVNTGYKVYPCEWDAVHAEIVFPPDTGDSRNNYLASLKEILYKDTKRFKNIIARLERTGKNYTAENVLKHYLTPSGGKGFISFARETIRQMGHIGKPRTAERYTAVIRSFERFCGENDVFLDEFDSDLMVRYENFLKAAGGVPQYHILLYAWLAGHLQPGCRKGTDRTMLSVQARLYGYRQDGQAGCPAEYHPPDPGFGLDALSGNRFCKGCLHVFVLHTWNVIHRHGISQEKRPSERNTLLSQTKNRTAAHHQMGEAHAGNHRQIRHRRHTLFAAYNQEYGSGCTEAVQECGSSGQRQAEEVGRTIRTGYSVDHLRGTSRLGFNSLEQEYPTCSHK